MGEGLTPSRGCWGHPKPGGALYAGSYAVPSMLGTADLSMIRNIFARGHVVAACLALPVVSCMLCAHSAGALSG